ncbi:beta strand repeat-containing protein [Sphingomonas sp. CJ20]
MAAGGTLTLSGGADVTLTTGAVYSFVKGVSSGTQGLVLNSTGQTMTVTSVDHVYAVKTITNKEIITLGGTAGNTLGVQFIDTIIGNTGKDVLTLTTGGSTMLVSDIQTLIGAGTGTDFITLADAGGSSVSISYIKSIMGGVGNDVLSIANTLGTTTTIGAIETILGASGNDIIATSTAAGGSTVMVSSVEVLVGNGSKTDVLTLADGGATIGIGFLETLIGSSGYDLAANAFKTGTINFLTGGMTLGVSMIDRIVGGSGARDALVLLDTGNTFAVSDIDTLIGSSGNDVITVLERSTTAVIGESPLAAATSTGTVLVAQIETILGTAQADVVAMSASLAAGGSTLSVSSIETIVGVLASTSDIVQLQDTGNTVSVALVETLVGSSASDTLVFSKIGTAANATRLIGIETVYGSANADSVNVGDGGSTTQLLGIETFTGGGGSDVLTLLSTPAVANTLTVDAVETIIGSAEIDAIVLQGGQTLSVSALDTVVGSTGTDVLLVAAGGATLQVTDVETIIGSADADILAVGTINGTTMQLTSVETVIGGDGNDVFDFTDTQATIYVSGVETVYDNGVARTLTGSGQYVVLGPVVSDTLQLPNGGNTVSVNSYATVIGGTDNDVVSLTRTEGTTIAVDALETLTGSGQREVVTITGTSGSTLLISSIEDLTGGSGNDAVLLAGGGQTLSVAGIETLSGGGEKDVVSAPSGFTMAVSQIETLIGSTVRDVVTSTGETGSTIAIAAVELVTGGIGNDVLALGDGGQTIALTNVESVIGSAGQDQLSLGDGGQTITITAVESITGGTGTDALALGDGGQTITVVAVESVTGSSSYDTVTLGAGGQTIHIAGIDFATGGNGNDAITLGSGGWLSVTGIESVTGSTGDDTLIFADGGQTVTVSAVDTLIGGSGNDTLILADGGQAITVSAVETLTGGTGNDSVTLEGGSTDGMTPGSGQTVRVGGVESVIGSIQDDNVTLADGGQTITITAVEILSGGSDNDSVTLGSGGQTLRVTGIESVTGGTGADNLTLGDGGQTITVSGVEILSGGTGNDSVTLGDSGQTLTITAVESVTGGSGNDRVLLGSGGQTVRLSGIESVIGSTGADVLTLADGGQTITVSGIETLAGGSGNDSVALVSGGNTLAVTAIESLTGSSGSDKIWLGNGGQTLSISTIETVTGGTGNDTLILASIGNTVATFGMETIIGGLNRDVVSLQGDQTVFVTGIETITGSTGYNAITLGAGGETLFVSAIEAVTGGAGLDRLVLSASGQTIAVSQIETLAGGTGLDIVSATAGATMNVSLVETLIGSAFNDIVSLASGATVTVAGFETVLGSTGLDRIVLGAGSQTVSATNVETIIGSTGNHAVTLGDGGQTVNVSGLQSVAGGSGIDRVTLLTGGHTIAVSQIETLVGGSGLDIITATAGVTMNVWRIETLIGSAFDDVINITGGATLAVSAIETVLGSTANNSIMLAGSGQTIALSDTETVIGSGGLDRVQLNAASTITVTAVESITGSTGNDSIVLAGSGQTIALSDAETVIGSGGLDHVQINAASTMTVTEVESITGSTGADHITVASGSLTAVTLDGGDGDDTIIGGDGNDTIIGGGGDDTIVGGGGADTLTGGTGANLFDVTDGDIVTDFKISGDSLRLSGATFAASDVSIASNGADAVLTIGSASPIVVTLQGQAGLTVADLVVANSNGATLLTFAVDPPAVDSITVDGTPAANATSITYTVVFTKPVTGVDISDFAIGGSSTLGGTIVAVSGNGTTYQVAIDQVAGEGTLRLDFVGNGSDVVDGLGIAIASTTVQGGAIALDTVAPTNLDGTLYATAAAPAGFVVGTVSAQDGNPLTYSLVDDAGGAYLIDAVTGVVTIANPSAVQFASGVQVIRVRASDGVNATTLDLNVRDAVPATPSDTDTNSDGVIEGAASGTTVGITASAVDPQGKTITYSLVDDAGGRFQIDSQTGVITVRDGTLLDHETATSHTVTVKADNGAYGTSTQSFAIAVANAAPSAPTDADTAANTVLEGAAGGTAVGITAAAADPNGPAVSYALASADTDVFAIDAASGVVTVKQGIAWTPSMAGTRTITVTASDGVGGSRQSSFDVVITPLATPAAPSAPALAAISDSGSSASDGITNATSLQLGGTAEAGTSVRLFIDGVDSGQTVTADGNGAYSFTLDASALTGAHSFTATATGPTGRTSTASSAASVNLDRTAPGIAGIALQGTPATDTTTLSWTVTFSEAVDALDAGSLSLAATGSASGTIATITRIDDHSFTVTATGIAGNGTLALGVGGTLMRDTAGNALSGTLASGGVAVAPTAIALANATATRSYLEDSGAVGLGAPSIDAAPAGSTITATLALASPALGALTTSGVATYDAATGIWTATGTQAQVNAALAAVSFTPVADNETDTSVTITVSSSAVGSTPATGTITLDVTPANDAPRIGTTLADQQIAEGGTLAFAVTAGAFTDIDAGDSLTYAATLADGSALPSWLTFDPATGAFTAQPGYADAGTVSVKVIAADRTGATASQTFTLAVHDTPPSLTIDADTAANTVLEGAAGGTAVGITAAAADPNGPAVSYALASADTDVFAIDATSGVVTVKQGIAWTPSMAGTRTITVTASDGFGGSRQSSFDVVITPLATPAAPSAPALAAISDSGSSASDGITNATSLQLGGTAEAGTSVRLFIDGVDSGQTVTADGNGAYSFTVDASALTGAHSFTATATGPTGRTSTASSAASVNLDRTAPGIAGIALQGTPATDTTTLSWTVTFSEAVDALDAGSLSLAATGSASGTIATITRIDDHSFTVTATGIAGNGTLALGVGGTLVRDTAGNALSGTLASGGVAVAPTAIALANATATRSYLEDSGAVGLGAPSIDAAPGGSTITATLALASPALGALTTSGVATYDAATGIWTATGTQAQVNAALAAVSFTPVADNETDTSVTITVSSSAVGSTPATGTITLDVTPANDAPRIGTTLADQQIAEGGTLAFAVPAGAFTDIDAGDSLTYAATLADGSALPSWLTFDPATGAFTAQPGYADAGTVSVKVVAADRTGATASQTFTLAVHDTPPSLTIDANTAANTVREGAAGGTAVGITAAAADPNGPAVSYALASADTDVFAIDATSGVVTVKQGIAWTPSMAGTRTITVTASDGFGGSRQSSFDVVITPLATPAAPSAPALAAISDSGSSASDGITNATSLQLGGTAEAGTSVRLFIDGVDSGQTVTADGNGAYSFTVDASALTGAHSFTATATGPTGRTSTASSAASVNLDRTAPGIAGVALQGTPATDTTTLSWTVTFSEAVDALDAGSLSLAATGSASGTIATITRIDDRSFTVTATGIAGNGTLALGVGGTLVRDLAGNALSGTLASGGVAVAPTAIALANATATRSYLEDSGAVGLGAPSIDAAPAGSTITATLALASPALGALTTSGVATYDAATGIWTATGTQAQVNAALAAVSFTPVADNETDTSVTITVSSSAVGSTPATGTITLDVTPANDAPRIGTTLADQQIAEGGTLAFAVPAGAFTDIDAGDSLTYAATLADGSALPSWLTFDPATGAFTAQPGYADAGTVSVKVVAADRTGATASQTFTLAVNDTPPSLTIDADTAANTVREGAAGGTAVGITAAAADPNGPAVSYALATADTDVFAIDATSGVVTVKQGIAWTPSMAGTRTITVTASDGFGGSRQSSFDVVITPLAAPAAPSAPALAAISDSGSSASDGITNATSLQLGGTAEAGTSVRLFIDGVDSGQTVTADGNGAYSFTVDASALTGAHSFTATATGPTGRTSTASSAASVNLDRTAPGIAGIALQGTPATDTTTLSWTVTFSEAVDALDAGSLSLAATGSASGTIATITRIDDRSFTVTATGIAGNGTLALGVGGTLVRDTAGNALSGTLASGGVAVAPTAIALANATATRSYLEDSGAVGLGAPSIDAAPAGSTITATLALASPALGALTTSGVATYDAATGIWTATGTQAQVNAALAAVSFTPVADNETDTSVTITVSSSAVGSTPATGTITLDVTPANDAPRIGTTLADQQIAEGGTLAFAVPAGAFTDIDAGDSLTYAATLADGSALPSWLTFDPATGAFTAQPGYADAGTVSVKVVAADRTGATASQTFTLAVHDTPPSLTIDANTAANTVREGAAGGTAVGITAAAADPNGPAVSYALASADTDVFAIDATSGVVTVKQGIAWTPSMAGTRTITVTASDGFGGSRQSSFDVVITPLATPAAPSAPALAAISDSGSSASDGITNATSLQLGGTAEAGTSVRLFIDGVDSGQTVTADGNGAYSFTVDASALTGAHSFTATATGPTGRTSTASSAASVNLDRTAPGIAGVALQGTPATDTTTLSWTVTFSEAVDALDAGSLSLAATGSASGTIATITRIDDRSFTVTATGIAGNGTLALGVGGTLVRDLAGNALSGTLASGGVAVAPTAIALANATATRSYLEDSGAVGLGAPSIDAAPAGSTITATLALASPALGALTTSGVATYDAATGIWTATGTQAQVNAALAAVSFTPVADNETDTSVTITVSSSAVGSTPATGTITLDVTPANDAPRFGTTLADQQIAEGGTLAFAVPAGAFTDIDAGDSLTYAATLADGSALPSWLTFDPATGAFTAQPGYADAGTVSVKVIAADRTGATASQTFTLAVHDTPPSLTIDADTAANTVLEGAAGGTAVGITAAAADPNGPAVSYALASADTDVFAIDATSGVVTVKQGIAWTPSMAGTRTITVTASDGFGGSRQSSFDVVITPLATPAAPSAPALAAISDSGSSASDGITNATSLQLGGTAEAGTSVRLFIDGVDSGQTVTADGNGAYSFTVDASALTGAHSFTATATGPTGRTSTASSAASVNLDRTAPGIAGIALQGTPATDTTTLSWTVTFSEAVDALDAGSLSLAATGSASGTIATITRIDDRSFTVTATGIAGNGTLALGVGGTLVRDLAGNALSGTLASGGVAVAPTAIALANATATRSYLEDSGAVGLGAPSIDAAPAGSTITATLALASPTLGALTTSGVATYDAATGIWTATGTQAQVNAALAAVSFTPVADNETDTSVTITVSSSAVGSTPATGTITLDVTPANDAPRIGTTLADQQIAEGGTLAFAVPAGAFTDIDAGDSLTYAATLADGSALPSWLTFDPATGAFTAQPGYADAGTVSVKVVAADRTGATASQTFTLAVHDTPPSLTIDANTAANTVREGAAGGTAVGITAAAADPNGPAVSYALASADTDVFAIDATSGVVTVKQGIAWTPSMAGTRTITVTASDGFGGSRQSSFDVVITPLATPAAPSAPALAAISDSGSSASDGITNATSLQLGGTAEAGTSVRLFIDGVDSGQTVTADGNGAYSFTVDASALTGAHSFTATATGPTGRTSTASSAASVNLDRTAPGIAGVALQGTPATDTTTLSWTVTFSEAVDALDAGSLSLAATGSASGTIATITRIDDRSFTVTATGIAGNGTLALGVGGTLVRDLAGNALSGTLASGGVAVAPTAIALANATATRSYLEDSGAVGLGAPSIDAAPAGSTITATLALASPALGALTTSGVATYDAATGIWTATGTQAQVNAALAAVSFTPVADNETDTSVTITVSSSAVGSTPATGTITLDVTPANDAPRFGTTLADQQIAEGGTLAFAVPAGAFTDIDAGDSLTYAATLADGSALPSWLTFDPATGAFTAQPGYADAGTVSVKVIAADRTGATASQTFTLAVHDTPPSLTIDADTAANTVLEGAAGGTAVGITAAAADPNGPAVSYALASADTDVFAIDATSGVVTVKQGIAWTPSMAGTRTITVTASDGFGGSRQSSFDVVITPLATPAAPSAPALAAISDSGSSASDGITNATSLQLGGTAEAGTSVRLFIDGVDSGQTVTADGNGAYSFTVDASALTGAHSFTATATGPTGRTSTASSAASVNLDRTAPGIAGIALQGTPATDTTTLSWTVTFSEAVDALDAGSLSLAATGSASGTIATITRIDDRSFTVTATGIAGNGTLALGVGGTLVRDLAGNALSGTLASGGVAVAPTAIALANATATRSYLEDSGAVGLGAPSIDAAPAGSTITATLALASPTLGALTTSGVATYDAATGIWTATGTQAQVNAALAAVSFTPVADNETDTSVTITVSSSAVGSTPATGTITLDVTPANDAPRIGTTLADQQIAEGGTLAFAVPAGAFTDIDAGDSLTYAATLADGSALPSWLTFDPATGAFTAQPGYADAGTVSVKVVAADRTGATASQTFAFTVTNVNRAPIATNDTARVDGSGMLSVGAGGLLINDRDPDAGDTVRVIGVNNTNVIGAFVTLASGARVQVNADGSYIYDANGAFSGLPGGAQSQDSFSYTIADGSGATSTATVTLTVESPSRILQLPDGGNGSDVAGGYDTIIGGAGIDSIRFTGAGGTTMAVLQLETLVGSSGNDFVTIGAGGAAMNVSLIESLAGGSGYDQILLGGVGNTIAISGVELLAGSGTKDWVQLGNGGNAITVTALETLTGGTGQDHVVLGGGGATTTVSGIETLVGGSGTDFIFLGGGVTMMAQGIDVLIGSNATDAVTLGDGGNILLVRAIETLAGGAGTDIVTIGNTGITMLASGIETLAGGTLADVVTIVGDTGVRFTGGGGADRIALGGGADQILFNKPTEGAATGANQGYDEILNFQSGADQIVLGGQLRTMLDHNGNGAIDWASRGTGAINIQTDEVVRLTTRVTNLTDANLTEVRAAIGSINNAQAGGSVMVMVSNGTDTGMYLVSKTDASAQVGTSDIRLLGVIRNSATPLDHNVIFGT